MVVPRDQALSCLKHQKMHSKRSVRGVRFGVNVTDDGVGMYHGFDWYGRTLEVREVRLYFSLMMGHAVDRYH